MSRKTSNPRFPDSYIGSMSNDYNDSIWMERNQKKTASICIQYLYDKKLNDIDPGKNLIEQNSLLLDLGCGTGFSSEILSTHGFRVVGVDILKDMLYKAGEKKKLYSEYKKIEFILADINSLPLREMVFDHSLSISAYNFITHGLLKNNEKIKRINATAKYLHKILKPLGRLIIEFYPLDEKELTSYISSFINNGFNGFLIKKYEKQKSGQTFILLKKPK
ncbi:MAG: class I SAM-dependent methyltransferase [Candidatus Lokiarchaeota archaeon]|nr:class I SAM-dependent methyltransferase [Candidatus Lokiarchaeota archaeon]